MVIKILEFGFQPAC